MNTKLINEQGHETVSSVLTRIHLWDLPVRIFHWALVGLVTTAVITGELGGDLMDIHSKAGIAIIGLVVFRLIWGFVGSTHARFINFAPSPPKIKAYLRGQWKGVGHNPIGALSVLALLALLAIQAGTGLFSNDDIAFTGPLADLAGSALSNRLTSIHQLLSNFLLGLLVLHIVAIGFYVIFKKDNLVRPMITGWKEVQKTADPEISVQSAKPVRKGSLPAFLVASFIALTVIYSVSGAARHEDTAAGTSPAATEMKNTPASASDLSNKTGQPVAATPRAATVTPSW